jgi:hypothetical protein
LFLTTKKPAREEQAIVEGLELDKEAFLDSVDFSNSPKLMHLVDDYEFHLMLNRSSHTDEEFY